MQKWEYFTREGVDTMRDQELNKVGEEGWELIAVSGRRDRQDEEARLTYVFKRPLA